MKLRSVRSLSQLVCVSSLLYCGSKIAVASAPSVVVDAQNILASGLSYPEGIAMPYFSSGAYYPAGELNSAVYGTEIQVTAGFNSRQDITSGVYAASQPLWSKSYSWDKNAQNLLSVTDQITGTARTFTYDNAAS